MNKTLDLTNSQPNSPDCESGACLVPSGGAGEAAPRHTQEDIEFLEWSITSLREAIELSTARLVTWEAQREDLGERIYYEAQQRRINQATLGRLERELADGSGDGHHSDV
jgi:hypothetical protein